MNLTLRFPAEEVFCAEVKINAISYMEGFLHLYQREGKIYPMPFRYNVYFEGKAPPTTEQRAKILDIVKTYSALFSSLGATTEEFNYVADLFFQLAQYVENVK